MGAGEDIVRRTSTNHSNAGEMDLFTILPDGKRRSTEVVVQHGSELDDLQVFVANVPDGGDDPEFGRRRDFVSWG